MAGILNSATPSWGLLGAGVSRPAGILDDPIEALRAYAATLPPGVAAGPVKTAASGPDWGKIGDYLLTKSWPSRMVQAAWGAATLPGDVYAGKVDPNSDEGIARANDLAGLVTLGAGAVPGGGLRAGAKMTKAAAPEAPAGLRVYHGSPHDFDKFDMSKIGTGEGAQAYGHGLYFAEKEGVARQYRDNLSTYNLIQDFNNANPKNRPGQVAQWWTSGMDVDRIDDALKVLEPQSTQAMRDQWIREGQKLYDEFQSKGRMYEARLNASPDEFLDWDKPVFKQGDAVKKAVYEAAAAVGEKQVEISRLAKNPAFAEELRKRGIKGIRYLDQGSRGVAGGEFLGVVKEGDGYKAKIKGFGGGAIGAAPTDIVTTSKAFPTEAEARKWAEDKISAGSRNYVVFDDNIIEILRKYGIAGLIGGAAGVGATMLQPGQAEAAEPTLSDILGEALKGRQ